jgi:heme/copper-type cytochrome/quinol oxidase subunit 2
MRMIDIKQNRKWRWFRGVVAFFLLCIVLSVASAQEQLPKADTNTSTVNISTATTMIPTNIAVFTIVVLVITFLILVLLCYNAKETGKLDMGEMRRAMAGTFVVGFTILMILCLTYDIYRSEVIMAYIELVGIVIGFYYGSRTIENKRN